MKIEIKSIKELVSEVEKEEIVLVISAEGHTSFVDKNITFPAFGSSWTEFLDEVKLELIKQNKPYFETQQKKLYMELHNRLYGSEKLQVEPVITAIKKLAPNKVFYANGCFCCSGGRDYLEVMPALNGILEHKIDEVKILTLPRWLEPGRYVLDENGLFQDFMALCRKMTVPITYVGIKDIEKN